MSEARIHIDAQLQVRRDIEANWTSVDPVLRDGEVAYSKDVKRVKIGDGASTWSQLPYLITDNVELSDELKVILERLEGVDFDEYAKKEDLKPFLILLDMFYWTEDGAIGTKYDFFSEKQLSAKGLNTAGGSGGGLITMVYGAADLGGNIPENNTATFDAYAINSIYLRLAQLEHNGGGGFDINQLENFLTTKKYVTQDWVIQQEFLDSAGGTIKGNLRLKANGSNFGNYLYFGDGSYCYIQEDKDDHLKIFADNGIAFVTDADKTATLNGENILTASALNSYATESWVEDKKYITAAALNGYATESWVIDKGYITAAALEFYATQSWVQSRGYITAEYLSGYASEQWVTERGYITATALKGYATESWVEAFGFVTAYQLSGMGFLTGITSKMVTDALGYYPFNSSGFSKANIQTTLGISDWALASTKPSYSFNEVGLGTGNITLNGSSSTFATVSGEVSDKTFYAPVTAGAKGTLLVGNGTGSAPTWATKSSIGLSEFDNDEGFLTSEDMADYATMEWVNGRGFLTSSSLSGYATQSWVEGKGYLTNGSLSGYATQSWVNQQGFITSLYLDAYPSKTWVEQNYLSLLGGTIEGDLFISDYLSIGSTSQTEQVTLSDSMQVGGYVSFGTVGANLGSTNPVSTFRQTIFGNTTNRSRIRTFRATSDISGFASAYAAGFAWAAGDTHAYIAVSPYKNSGMNSIWIGAGDAGVIDWVCNVFHNQANLIPGSNGSYTLGSSNYGWLAGYFHRSANGDVISINDTRTSQGYQAIRFNRNGTDYAAMQWFHDGFNSSSYWWNSKSCLNFDTNTGGTITFGTWSSPLFIIDNTNRRNVIPAGIPLVFLDSSGNAHSLSYDSSKSAFKFDGNVYSTQEIAAKGMSASDGMARIASLESTIASQASTIASQASEITALKKRVTALE